MFNNEPEKHLKIAIYTRVSTEDQAKDGFSLDAQMKKLRAYCVSRDWTVYKEYTDDGYTGRNIKRPAYQQMFQDMNHWDGILALKMDRIHRNKINFLEMMDQLNKLEKQFISCFESLDTSNAMGRFVMDIIQGIAQLESEQIGERVTMAMIQKALDTSKSYAGGRPPFGYHFKKGERKGEGKIIPIPDQLELIKKVYKLYSEGKTMQDIANITGKAWSQVRYWLNNTFYFGLAQWGNCFKKVDIEPVISLDLWNVCQSMKNKGITKFEEGTCRFCGSSDITKKGNKITKNGKKQRYFCNSCNRRFVNDPEKPGPIKPFIREEMPDSFTLSDKEMREYGFGMDIIKNQGV